MRPDRLTSHLQPVTSFSTFLRVTKQVFRMNSAAASNQITLVSDESFFPLISISDFNFSVEQGDVSYYRSRCTVRKVSSGVCSEWSKSQVITMFGGGPREGNVQTVAVLAGLGVPISTQSVHHRLDRNASDGSCSCLFTSRDYVCARSTAP